MKEDIVGFQPNLGNTPTKVTGHKKSGNGFQSFGLSAPILKGIQRRGYKQPTPIQRKSIPLILEGRDVVAMARTGSGKTACFLLPLFERLLKKKSNLGGGNKPTSGIRSLILSPTRELALQTLRFIRDLGKFTGLRGIAVLGGDSMDDQFGRLHENPDIVVATPGRFLHLCVEMDLKLNSVECVVFDEADRLFEMGFGDQLREIVNRLGTEGSRQTVLFSATLPKLLVSFARAGLNDPALIRLDVDEKLPDTLQLAFLPVRTDDKSAALLALLQALQGTGSGGNGHGRTLVFFATRHHVEYMHMLLDKAGISNTFIYSDLDASARKINAAKFQNGNITVMLVTDVAARGVDIPHLDYVINYHFPAKSKLFIHRVGRCARAGRSGTAFSLMSPEECPFVIDLHLFLGRPITALTTNSTNKDCVFGQVPPVNIETEHSRIIAWHEIDAELTSMRKVCDNGYKKYLRSRPGASSESVKRAKELNFSALATHPLFHLNDSQEDAAHTLLDQMKKYKPKGTIFEVNVSTKSKGYAVMKTTKKIHERGIQHFKLKKELANPVATSFAEDRVLPLEIGNEADVDNTFSTIIMGKRKMTNSFVSECTRKKKRKTSYIDKEHYIPHAAPDRHTEEGLAINNFSTEADKLAFDLTGDTDEGLISAKRMKKWDKKKKKMVGVESGKAGKIKTESGVWISKTYKSNRYAEWKEKSRMAESIESSDDDTEENSTKISLKKKSFPNTHWGRHNRKVAEKVKNKTALRKPEQIAKARKDQHKRRMRSLPKNKKFNKNSRKGHKKRK